MQIRLLACGAGGLAGVALASWINGSLGLSAGMGLAVCAGVGVALGYVVSILFDAFAPAPGNKPSPHP